MMTDEAKKARNEYMRKWRKENKEKVNEYNRNYRKNHKDMTAKSNARYWEKVAARRKEDANEENKVTV